jgi:hypothetical protein
MDLDLMVHREEEGRVYREVNAGEARWLGVR